MIYYMGPNKVEKMRDWDPHLNDKIKSRNQRAKLVREIRATLDQINITLSGEQDRDTMVSESSEHLAAMANATRYRSGALIKSYLNGLAVEPEDIDRYNEHIRVQMLAIMEKAKKGEDLELSRPEDTLRSHETTAPIVPDSLPDPAEWCLPPSTTEWEQYNRNAELSAKEVLKYLAFRKVHFAKGFVTQAELTKAEGEKKPEETEKKSEETAPAS